MTPLQTFGEMGKAKQRDVFRAWVSGKCEYYSNSGEWLPLAPPTADSFSYISCFKAYRVAASKAATPTA